MPLLGSTRRKNGLARNSGNCQLIQPRRPPGSPSGMRFSLLPSLEPQVWNTSWTVSRPILPTKWTFWGARAGWVMSFLLERALGRASSCFGWGLGASAERGSSELTGAAIPIRPDRPAAVNQKTNWAILGG